MKDAKDIIRGLPSVLFWDTDIAAIDPDKHVAFIIERVLSMGTIENFKDIIDYYGREKIKNLVTQIRYMDDRVLHFCGAYFDIPLSQFRCYTQRQLNQAHWSY